MSMYVELLSSALNGRLDDMSGDALEGHALSCRAEMLMAETQTGASAYASLAAEVAYDRALLKLCTTHGIDVVASDFSHPEEERRRLECQLASVGLDLVALAARRSAP